MNDESIDNETLTNVQDDMIAWIEKTEKQLRKLKKRLRKLEKKARKN